MKIKILIPVLFLFLPNFLSAESKPIFRFKHLTTDEGLSQSRINCIFQDSRGFIWIGSDDGLNLYDGYEITVFNNASQNAISGNLVFDIIEDLKGDLLIATNEGVDILDYITGKIKPLIFLDPDTITRVYTKKLGINKDKQIWAISHSKIYILNPDYHFTPYLYGNNKEIAVNRISDFIFDEDNIWLTSETEGLLNFNFNTHKTSQFNHRNSIITDELFCIYKDCRNNILIGSSDGVFIIRKKQKDTLHLINKTDITNYASVNSIYDIIEDEYNKGNYWFSTSGGLTYFNDKIKEFTVYKYNKYSPSGINTNALRVIFKDIQGNIWIGTRDRGINIIEKQYKKFDNQVSLEFNSRFGTHSIMAIFEDSRGNLWVGTDGDGVYIWNKNKADFIHFKHIEGIKSEISANDIMSIAEDQKGNIWIGTFTKGITILNVNYKAIKYFSFEEATNNQINYMLKDSYSNMWIGTNGSGLQKYNSKLNRFDVYKTEETSLSSNYIITLMEDSKRQLWVGTYWGLNILDLKSNKITAIYQTSQKGSLSNNAIYSLCEDRQGKMWIGTPKGLNLWNPENNTFRVFLKRNGLPNNVINNILCDKENNLWLGTNNGISRYSQNENTFINFDKNDGLLSNNIVLRASHQNSNGFLFFGNNEGFNAFNPNEIKINDFIPPVYITDIKLFNNSIKNQIIKEKDNNEGIEKISLAYNENFITIEYVALNYINSGKNQYAYILEGFDNTWHNVYTQRVATYTNLDPGEYLFKVKACNNDGIWNETGASLKIIIKPPFWLTWWAYIIYLILIVLLLLLFRQFISNREKLKHNLEIEKLEHQKAEELYQSKMRFFTNISHEFRTPLTLILAPLENLVQSGSKISKGSREGLLKLAYRNSARLLQLINQLLDIRKVELGKMNISVEEFNVVDEIKDISASFTNLADRRNIDFSVHSKENEIISWLDKEKFRQVMYNLISNAFKYTLANGKVTIRIFKKQNFDITNEKIVNDELLSIEVEDNGIGIKEKDIPFIFNRFYHAGETKSLKQKSTGIGLSLTKDLVQMHSGTINVNSEPGKGSIFTVTFPIGKSHYKAEDFKSEYEEKNIDFETPVFDEFEEIHTEEIATIKNLPKLLLIEDNLDLRSYLASILNNDYQILEAENGIAGWNAALKNNPDLIISDIMMPELDGISLLKQLKNDLRTSHVPVILLTAKNQIESQIKGLETGADDYIPKPFNNEILLLKIKNILKARETLLKQYKKKPDIDFENNNFSIVDRKFLKRTMDIINKNINDIEFSVEKLGSEVGLSRSQLFRKLKVLINQNPNELIRNIRLEKAAELLKSEKLLEIYEVMDRVGFQNINYFRKCFINHFGVKPEWYGNEQ